MSSEAIQLAKPTQNSQQATLQTTQTIQQPTSAKQQQRVQSTSQPKQMGYYEAVWKGIIRPPRFLYSINDLGKEVWVQQNVIVRRYDFEVQNQRNLKVQCSLFEPMRVFEKPHNCIIYLHGNSSSRVEALGVLEFIIPADMALCALDFAGCGLSEGEYVSLGYHEQDDVQVLVEYLRKNKPMIKNIGLWGRSMGAVTSILACRNNDDIKVLVCDSPFRNLRQLCQELAWKQYRVPRCLFAMVFCCIRNKIYEQARFDINQLNIVKEVASLPPEKSILFLSAKSDLLIEYQHPFSLYTAFRGYKKILQFEGNHNSRRPPDIHKEIQNFFLERLDSGQSGKLNHTTMSKQSRIQLHQVKPKTPTPDESDPMIKQNIEMERVQNHTFAFPEQNNQFHESSGFK